MRARMCVCQSGYVSTCSEHRGAHRCDAMVVCVEELRNEPVYVCLCWEGLLKCLLNILQVFLASCPPGAHVHTPPSPSSLPLPSLMPLLFVPLLFPQTGNSMATKEKWLLVGGHR